MLRIKSAIALCRCYRESGDFRQAIEVGERVLAQLASSPSTPATRPCRWPSPLAAAYFSAATSGQAVRICRKAIAKAEGLASAGARARRTGTRASSRPSAGRCANAVPLAERALALIAEGQDARNLARLRTQLGIMQLELDPPDIAEAHAAPGEGRRGAAWCSASPVEIATNDLARARAFMLDGDLDRAEEMCRQTFDVATSDAPSTAAHARALLGQILAERGDIEGANAAYRQAVFFLTSAGADNDAAQLWFELADLLEDVGDLDAARQAYRSAAASTGLRSRTRAAVSV